jgi:hypothetical protein
VFNANSRPRDTRRSRRPSQSACRFSPAASTAVPSSPYPSIYANPSTPTSAGINVKHIPQSDISPSQDALEDEGGDDSRVLILLPRSTDHGVGFESLTSDPSLFRAPHVVSNLGNVNRLIGSSPSLPTASPPPIASLPSSSGPQQGNSLATAVQPSSDVNSCTISTHTVPYCTCRARFDPVPDYTRAQQSATHDMDAHFEGSGIRPLHFSHFSW